MGSIRSRSCGDICGRISGGICQEKCRSNLASEPMARLRRCKGKRFLKIRRKKRYKYRGKYNFVSFALAGCAEEAGQDIWRLVPDRALNCAGISAGVDWGGGGAGFGDEGIMNFGRNRNIPNTAY